MMNLWGFICLLGERRGRGKKLFPPLAVPASLYKFFFSFLQYIKVDWSECQVFSYKVHAPFTSFHANMFTNNNSFRYIKFFWLEKFHRNVFFCIIFSWLLRRVLTFFYSVDDFSFLLKISLIFLRQILHLRHSVCCKLCRAFLFAFELKLKTKNKNIFFLNKKRT